MSKKLLVVALLALVGEAWAESTPQGLPEFNLPSFIQVKESQSNISAPGAAPTSACAGIVIPQDPNNVPVPDNLWGLAFDAIKLEFMRVNGRHVLAPADVLERHGGLWQRGIGGPYRTDWLMVTADVNGWPNPQINDRATMECRINLAQNPNTCAWAADDTAWCEPKQMIGGLQAPPAASEYTYAEPVANNESQASIEARADEIKSMLERLNYRWLMWYEDPDSAGNYLLTLRFVAKAGFAPEPLQQYKSSAYNNPRGRDSAAQIWASDLQRNGAVVLRVDEKSEKGPASTSYWFEAAYGYPLKPLHP